MNCCGIQCITLSHATALNSVPLHRAQPEEGKLLFRQVLHLAHWGVHIPLQATREDYEAVGDITPHRLRVYAAMVRALDRSVGRIMATLEAEGLAEYFEDGDEYIYAPN